MFKRLSAGLVIVMVIGLLCLLVSPAAAAEPPEPVAVKELNFVFLHGLGGNSCTLQLLADLIDREFPEYARQYEAANPGIKIEHHSLNRCYPNTVDLDTWANNIAVTISEHLPESKNIILVGHSMGGKAALHAVARNFDNIYDKVALVVTLNSPIQNLNGYYIAGGGSVETYCRTGLAVPDMGACGSIAQFGSCSEGVLISNVKHWLAFISAEAAPLSQQFNYPAVDGWPRDMDDGLVPISAQYCGATDVVYYGQYGHSEFGSDEVAAGFIAGQILNYIFGGPIECSVLAHSGSLEHKAGWLPGVDRWEDIAGEVAAAGGLIEHKNESFFRWEEWEDVVGEAPGGDRRSSYDVAKVGVFPFFSGVTEVRWLNPENSRDSRLYIRTRVAPRSTLRVEWTTRYEGLLPQGSVRDHFEVAIETGTPLTSIPYVSWYADDPRDLRLRIFSEAERPFRWFRAVWRVYYRETRERGLIDDFEAN